MDGNFQDMVDKIAVIRHIGMAKPNKTNRRKISEPQRIGMTMTSIHYVN